MMTRSCTCKNTGELYCNAPGLYNPTTRAQLLGDPTARYYMATKSYKPKRKDTMLTLSIWTVSVCLLKFLLEGVQVTFFGHPFDFGHADALVYGAILTPVLGAHGYMKVRSQKSWKSQKADNPDGN